MGGGEGRENLRNPRGQCFLKVSPHCFSQTSQAQVGVVEQERLHSKFVNAGLWFGITLLRSIAVSCFLSYR